VNALGYGDPGLKQALHSAAEGLIHTSNLYATAPGEQLAHTLVEKSFASKIFFCNSGAEANEGAFKFARRWARTRGEAKHELISLRGAFHGRLFASLAATDRPSYRVPFRPLAPGISIVERDIEDLAIALNSETVAALILEPVQGEGGVRVLDAGFVREVRALTKERDVLLIFDEIQCGLGRTGTLFAYEQFGVEPDMLTLAKPLAGGLPMAAVLMTEAIAETIKPGDHGTTFGGGPFIASVANHVVERVSDPAMLKHITENGEWLGEELNAIAHRTGRIRAVRGLGYMWGIDVMGTASHVVNEAFNAGLLTCSAGEYTVRLLPPLVMTRERARARPRDSRRGALMTGRVTIRRARPSDAANIARLIGLFADQALMLRRTPEIVELRSTTTSVGVDARDNIVACGALKEYSLSVAEIAAIAVSPDAHGRGVGKAIVNAVEALAIKRGTFDVFALTLQPEFFAAIGYLRVDRARYPEKIRRDCLACARRFACNEICFAKNLKIEERPAVMGVVAAGVACQPERSEGPLGIEEISCLLGAKGVLRRFCASGWQKT